MKKSIFSAILRTIRAKVAHRSKTVRAFFNEYGEYFIGGFLLLTGWGFCFMIFWLGC